MADRDPDDPPGPGSPRDPVAGAPRYPRDMRGHGRIPPDPRWPGGARVAVQIVVNYEEGGESNVLHGDPASEAFLSEISGAEPWPGRRHWNMESIYEYGARAGFWRLHRLLADLPVTVFGVASALARAPEQVEAMREAGWEIASHGLRWIEHAPMSEEAEAAQIDAAIRLHEEVVGERPRGWYTGRCSMRTMRLAARHDLDWLSDSYADELPYWVRLEGRDRLVVPYTLDANDMRFSVPAGFGAGPDFEAYLRDTLDCLHREGGRMMSVGLHCRLAGRPGRAEALRRFLDHARGLGGVWFATRGQVAAHWRREHPPGRATPPSLMSREEFVAAFGGAYEGSPWIAERAHALELGPSHDSVAGVASALARAFRAASREERLGVLHALPAHAALDTMSGEDRARLEALEARYVDRFGHPFVAAVRDRDAAAILREIEARLGGDPRDELAAACAQAERVARLWIDGRPG